MDVRLSQFMTELDRCGGIGILILPQVHRHRLALLQLQYNSLWFRFCLSYQINLRLISVLFHPAHSFFRNQVLPIEGNRTQPLNQLFGIF